MILSKTRLFRFYTISLVVAAFIFVGGNPAAGAAPLQNGVTIEEQKSKLLVTSGDLAVTFRVGQIKAGQIISIQYRGKDFISEHKGGSIRSFGVPLKDGQPILKSGKSLLHAWDYKIVREREYTEIVFFEKATPQWPMTTHISWIFKHGSPGLYYTLHYQHDADMPDVLLEQTRMSMMVSKMKFQKAYVDNNRIYDVVPINQWDGHQMIMDATYLLKNGSAITKYSWVTRKEHQAFYGYAGSDRGIFQLFPSMEHVNGGANKQSNSLHHTPDGPVLLNVMSSSHFGADKTEIQGDWNKLYGPFFVLFTDENTWEKNVEVAQQKQIALKKQWPFEWYKHPDYHHGRGTVTGQVNINLKPASNALVLFSTQKASNMSGTLNHGLGNMYWTRTNNQGQFRIPKIVPGKYFAYVNQPGVFGDFHSSLESPYEIISDTTKDVGPLNFTEQKFGETLWQIGTPDRDSTEFQGAQNNAFRPYLGLFRLKETYGGDNPVFKVGVSDPARDFYYAHPKFLANLKEYINLVLDVPDSDHSSFTKLPERIIEFQLPQAPEGSYQLTIAIASSRDADLNLLLNDTLVDQHHIEHSDSAGPRSGSYGRPSEWKVMLPTALLQKGNNRLKIQHERGLVLNKNRPPKQPNKEITHGSIYAEDPSANLHRILKGSLFSSILYDAIKLERKN